MLALCQCEWQRANARNICFFSFLQWPIYAINAGDNTKLPFFIPCLNKDLKQRQKCS